MNENHWRLDNNTNTNNYYFPRNYSRIKVKNKNIFYFLLYCIQVRKYVGIVKLREIKDDELVVFSDWPNPGKIHKFKAENISGMEFLNIPKISLLMTVKKIPLFHKIWTSISIIPPKTVDFITLEKAIDRASKW